MKIADCIHYQIEGQCKIEVDNLVKCFGKSFIKKWHDKYILVNRRAGVKVQLFPEEALELIRRLDLEEHPNFFFSYASYFTRSAVV